MKNNKKDNQTNNRKAYWQIFPSLTWWKKTPNISKEIHLGKHDKKANQ
jgi:hypothetical protein